MAVIHKDAEGTDQMTREQFEQFLMARQELLKQRIIDRLGA